MVSMTDFQISTVLVDGSNTHFYLECQNEQKMLSGKF